MVNLTMGLVDMTRLPLDLTLAMDPIPLTMVSHLAAINFELRGCYIRKKSWEIDA